MPGIHVVVQSSRNVPANALTFAYAKRWVARGVSSVNDPQKLSQAGDAIWAAIQEWNTRHPFNFSSKSHTDITLVVGTMDYDLPSDFNHVHSVRIEGGNDYALRAYPRSLRNRMQDGEDTDFSGPPGTYDIFNVGQLQTISIFPPPDTADTLKIDYYKLITEPVADGEILDLPKKYAWGILYLAKVIMLLDHDPENARVAFWERKAERIFRQARADDDSWPDADLGFVPKAVHNRQTYPIDDPRLYEEEW